MIAAFYSLCMDEYRTRFGEIHALYAIPNDNCGHSEGLTGPAKLSHAMSGYRSWRWSWHIGRTVTGYPPARPSQASEVVTRLVGCMIVPRRLDRTWLDLENHHDEKACDCAEVKHSLFKEVPMFQQLPWHM